MNSLYNQDEKVAIDRSPSDALLLINSADRSSSTTSTGQILVPPYTQPYNNFRLQKPQNMVQGGFSRLKLTEINFPYAIPNINDYTNSFWVQIVNPASPPSLITQKISILNNYYSGQDLANTLAGITGEGVMNNGTYPAISTTPGYTWIVTYLPKSHTNVSQYGGFQIICNLTASPYTPIPFKIFPSDPNTIGSVPIAPKSMLSVMGFNPLTNWNYLTSFSQSKQSLYASLSYTSFVDVVSKKLTYYQRVADGTTNLAGQSEVICRIYVADEISAAGTQGVYYNGESDALFNPVVYQANLPPGSAPFLIHRQFMCPKSFRWDPNTAIDWFDISLYDDVGQPLFYSTSYAYPDFQITMKCTED
jgi:hypothetical protein